jgi:hypothetical protein
MTREPRASAAALLLALLAATTFTVLPRPASAFEPSLSALVLGAGQPVISGETNLPDGSELVVKLARPESGFSAQAKATVSLGQFKTAPYADNGKDLAPGKYDVTITMSMAAGQPPAVQGVVGKSGEKCTGKLVKLGPFGVYLEQDFSFTVGGK